MEQPSRIETMQKIAGWLSTSVVKGSSRDRQITRWCGTMRIWVNERGRYVEVGQHGRGKPIIMIEKRPVQANESLFSPS